MVPRYFWVLTVLSGMLSRRAIRRALNPAIEAEDPAFILSCRADTAKAGDNLLLDHSGHIISVSAD